MSENNESGPEEAGQEEAILRRIVQENDATSDVYELVSQFRGKLPIRNYGHIRSAVARGIRLRGKVHGHHHFENRIPESFYPIEDDDTLVDRAHEVMQHAYQQGYPRRREVDPTDVERARQVLRQAGQEVEWADIPIDATSGTATVSFFQPNPSTDPSGYTASGLALGAPRGSRIDRVTNTSVSEFNPNVRIPISLSFEDIAGKRASITDFAPNTTISGDFRDCLTEGRWTARALRISHSFLGSRSVHLLLYWTQPTPPPPPPSPPPPPNGGW